MKKIYRPCKNCKGYGEVHRIGKKVYTADHIMFGFNNYKGVVECPACSGTGASPKILGIIL